MTDLFPRDDRTMDQDTAYGTMRDAMADLIEAGDTPWTDILTAVMVLARRARADMLSDVLLAHRDALLTAARHQDNLRKFTDRPLVGELEAYERIDR